MSRVLRESPDQPEMRKALQSAQRLVDPVCRFKNDLPFQLLGQPRLPRDPELGREVRTDMGDRFYLQFMRQGIDPSGRSRTRR